MRLKEFDTQIYPCKLAVAIIKDNSDLKKINELYTYIDGTKIIWEDFVHKAEVVRVNKKGIKNEHFILIVFNKPYFTCSVIAHESFHAAAGIFSKIGETNLDCEPCAYLIEWIADCCWSMKKKKHG